jgi:outer membrane lipoprotein carrier protein
MALGIFFPLLISPLFSLSRGLNRSIGFGLSNGPAAETSELLLRQFEARYRDAETLQVTFLERYFDNGRVVRVEAGDAYFLRPGKMRWDYQSPEKNTFLVDGKYVWFYSPADHTATRMPAKQSQDWRTPIAFLTSHVKLSRFCSEVSVAQDQKPIQFGNTLYHCTLRGAPGPESSAKKSVYFEVSPAGELSRIMIPQEGGIEIEFGFSAWRWNPLLDRSLFQFLPPVGVAIVDGLLPDTPGLRQ